MMGIKKVENQDSEYIVNILLAPSYPKKFFANQEVIIPTQILVSDNDNLKKIQAIASEKLRLLTMYKSIINEYNIPNRINIYGDYEATLNEDSNVKCLKFKN